MFPIIAVGGGDEENDEDDEVMKFNCYFGAGLQRFLKC